MNRTVKVFTWRTMVGLWLHSAALGVQPTEKFVIKKD